MWGIAFERFLRRLIVEGRLEVRLPGRAPILCGDGTGPLVSVTIADRATARRLLLDPELALGETYTDGRLTIDGDDLQGFLEIVMRNAGRGGCAACAARAIRTTANRCRAAMSPITTI
jgi:cyclopropane-fatty-acyl-phospholipid synthase